MSEQPHSQRPRIVKRIHDLLLHELGEHIDVGLMLGPPEYARAVVSLCRGSRNAELQALGEEFTRVTRTEAQNERGREPLHIGLPPRRGAEVQREPAGHSLG